MDSISPNGPKTYRASYGILLSIYLQAKEDLFLPGSLTKLIVSDFQKIIKKKRDRKKLNIYLMFFI